MKFHSVSLLVRHLVSQTPVFVSQTPVYVSQKPVYASVHSGTCFSIQSDSEVVKKSFSFIPNHVCLWSCVDTCRAHMSPFCRNKGTPGTAYNRLMPHRGNRSFER